ncbi:MAG: leucine--tRNA ligase [Euryarchaeota archaeon]|nr:leucine--tRNA ligase [Euryarchaeota archaeon]
MPSDDSRALDFAAIEARWQGRWYGDRVFDSEPVEGAPKYFIIFAYPGTSGYLHVGHMRAYTYTDIMARFMRMKGFNVLFPVGAHATGNVSITPAKKVERGDTETLAYFRANGCTEDELRKLSDPLEVVRFFSKVYVDDYWKRFGFSADFRRFCTTIDPGYMRFIEWQFLKLKERGLLFQKPYMGTACLKCGPVAVDPSETDISSGGNAEKQEYTLLKCRSGDRYLVAATLRPETVYGQTNFWANPGTEYVEIDVEGEKWVVSPECAEKLSHQIDGVRITGNIPGRALIGTGCKPPVIDREILVLPASFCDPNVGTGLVTSVPSDAPYDWIALRELQEDEARCKSLGLDPAQVRAIEAIPIIRTPGFGPLPAKEICERMGISKLGDPRLEEATKEIYSTGFHTGVMNDLCGEFAGLNVSKAKDRMKAAMFDRGEAALFYDMSEPVTCRCGGKVIVKKIPDQWFIDYGNREITDLSKEHAASMRIMPPEYHANLPGILEWFQERSCARLGNWLGTPLPFDRRWIVEAISDSTLYPAYYLISKYVTSGELRPEEMDESFFDYIFLDKGTQADRDGVSVRAEIVTRKYRKGKWEHIPKIADRIRRDVEYWYPLDVNLGGKEHMTVHFPVFLMNHVAILPVKMWPKGILVNWYIVMKGGKISKSKGGAEPIPDAVKLYSVDGMRLYYAHSASPFVDVEWDDGIVRGYRQRVERIYWQYLDAIAAIRDASPPESRMDRWLEAEFTSSIDRMQSFMDAFDLRAAAGEIFFTIPDRIRWYERRGGQGAAMKRILPLWAQAMAPFVPHVAEELWERLGHKDFVSTSLYPAEAPETDREVAAEEDYIVRLMGDLAQVRKVTGIEKGKVWLYVAEEWKCEVMAKVSGLHASGTRDTSGLIKAVMQMPSAKAHAKEAAAFVQKAAKDIAAGQAPSPPKDEHALLSDSTQFLSRETGFEIVVQKAGEKGIHDPKGKARAAAPGRPAIYAEAI